MPRVSARPTGPCRVAAWQSLDLVRRLRDGCRGQPGRPQPPVRRSGTLQRMGDIRIAAGKDPRRWYLLGTEHTQRLGHPQGLGQKMRLFAGPQDPGHRRVYGREDFVDVCLPIPPQSRCEWNNNPRRTTCLLRAIGSYSLLARACPVSQYRTCGGCHDTCPRKRGDATRNNTTETSHGTFRLVLRQG